MTGALPAAPHSRGAYAFGAVAGSLFGCAFLFGIFDATAPVGLRLARVAIAAIFLLAAYQSIERLWHPDLALRRSGHISERTHRTLHLASVATLRFGLLAFVVGCGLRWFGTPTGKDVAPDLQFLFAVFFSAAYWLADWNGENLSKF
jgi:hypothetical protein